MYIKTIQHRKVTTGASVHCRRFLLGGGGVQCSGCVGCGQTRSRQSGGQNSNFLEEILLPFKWESWQRDDGRKVILGRLPARPGGDLSLSGLVTESLTITLPGFV